VRGVSIGRGEDNTEAGEERIGERRKFESKVEGRRSEE